MVLKDEKGLIADVLFHAECGSAVYSACQFFGGVVRIKPYLLPQPELVGKPWTVSLRHRDIENVFGRVVNLSRDSAFSPDIVVDDHRFSAENFRLQLNRSYGWNTVPSNEYTISKMRDSWVFNGQGRGHLIGLCQQQANDLAQRGWSAEQLLSFFYPNYQIAKL